METRGQAAHGSRFDLGIDANMRMGRVLTELAELERRLRDVRGHPLAGPPSLHVPLVQGGTGPSTYSARCRLEIERRTTPGEDDGNPLAEIEEILQRLHTADPTFEADVRVRLTRRPFEISPDAPIVSAVSDAVRRVLGQPSAHIGMPHWMDAALLAEAGIETVVVGPIGGGAHAEEEWVDVQSVITLADILARAVKAYCA